VGRAEKGFYLRQAVTLTGLGVSGYELVLDGITAIHALFSRQFKEGALDAWQTDNFGEYTTITIANRYFTPRTQCPCITPVPFHATVDPQGYLANLTGDKLVHVQDNEVLYYKQVHKENSSLKS
jgi:hypothetical protein